jgi:L-threonylcarbamoyladenylate synthase
VSCPEAVKRIFDIKDRPLHLTLPIAVGDVEMLLGLASADGWRRERIESLLPGPYTFVLRARVIADPRVVRDGTVAVRLPAHPLYPRLTRRFGPIALTSANPHGGDDILTAALLDSLYGRAVTIVSDDAAVRGSPSEIVDLTGDRPKVLRSGNLNKGKSLEGPDGRI